MGTFTVQVINVKILPYARIVRSLIVDRCVMTVEYVRMYIAVDYWIGLNRVVTSKDIVLLICLNH